MGRKNKIFCDLFFLSFRKQIAKKIRLVLIVHTALHVAFLPLSLSFFHPFSRPLPLSLSLSVSLSLSTLLSNSVSVAPNEMYSL